MQARRGNLVLEGLGVFKAQPMSRLVGWTVFWDAIPENERGSREDQLPRFGNEFQGCVTSSH